MCDGDRPDNQSAWVAVSGGVDSAVAALIATGDFKDVVGVTMRLGVDEGVDVRVADAAAEVCESLGIRHRVVDMSEQFAECVVDRLVGDYMSGMTPNPCVVCNDQVKFGLLLERALSEGVGVLVTGHYARIGMRDGARTLLRGLDAGKDQSYFLYRLIGARLAHVRFPLGGLLKSEVREMARGRGLVAADTDESQDICFLGGSAISDFLVSNGATGGGEIVDLQGKVLGRHAGAWRFTVGQRKGIGVSSQVPLYVVRVEADTGRVVVGPLESCGETTVRARDVVWDGPDGEYEVEAQIRFRSAPVKGLATVHGTTMELRFEREVTGVAFGQSLVCYVDDRVMGGGYLTGES